MSTILPKDKKKRSRSSSSEANNSFVRNVTSRMTGLLPATITRWFSSPRASSANGSARAAVTADSADTADTAESSDDETPDSPALGRPPAKRMRYAAPVIFNHYSSTDANNVTNNIDSLEQCSPYDTVQSPPGRTTFRRETQFVSTPLRPPDDESTVDKSAKDSTVFKLHHTVSTTSTSVAPKRKSLFGSPFDNESSVKACETACDTMEDSNQPRFKPSLLGSPFYPGRTTYGGASASYVNHANIRQRKNTLVYGAHGSDTNAISHSARRVMDLLEQYSSPLTEARRIPPYVRPNSLGLNNSLDYSSHNDSNRIALYNKTQELHVPSIASILRLKQRSRLMDTTAAARQILASHSSTADYLPYPTGSSAYRDETEKESSKKFTTKIKTRLTRSNRGESKEPQTDVPDSVNLPAAPLQIDQHKLPKFSFAISAVPNAAYNDDTARTNSMTEFRTHFSEIKPTSTITETPIRKPDTVPNSNPYTFSSPVKISRETSQSSTTPPKYMFGSPERRLDDAELNENDVDEPSWFVGAPKEAEVKAVASEPYDGECSNCRLDVEECVCRARHKPSPDDKDKKRAKCAVCKVKAADAQCEVDECLNCEKNKVNNIYEPFSTKAAVASKWKCGDCWVDNDAAAGTCVCCGGKNPDRAAPVVKQNAVTSKADGEWKCEDCWIKNKGSADTCDACGGDRPRAEIRTSSLFMNAPKLNDFKKAILLQSQKWECPSCLVRNDCDKEQCVCCDTDKPGITKRSEDKSFKFGVNTTFKFGIDLKAHEVSPPKPIEVRNSFGSKAKVQSETNNNSLPKTPSFTFGVPAKQTATNKKLDETAQSIPIVGFTFGVPQSTSTPAVTSIFGVPNESPTLTPKAIEDTEKPQVVPKVDFPVTKTLTVSKNVLASLSSAEAESDATLVSPISNASVALLNNKDVPLSSVTLPLAASRADETPTHGFTFASAGLKPAVNIFAVPGATAPPAPPALPATTAAAFMLPAQSTPLTAAVSMFQKSEPPALAAAVSLFQTNDSTSASVSLFQKSEPSTVAPPSLGATAPMFSFGAGSAQTATSQPEKQKFNFTFGGANKTEASSLFKPTFGATTDDATANKFTMSTENALGNSLGGGIGMLTRNVTNPLAGGSEANNPLTSGNSLQSSNTPPASGGIFGTPVPKENIWSSGNGASFGNMFTSSATSNGLQKPTAFTFGSSTPFSAPQSFGGAATAPLVFGMAGSGNQTVPSMFASPPPPAAASMGMFAAPPAAAASAFPSSTFDAPAPAPAFNFGAQQSTGIFGFGQPQQQQQHQQQQHQQQQQQSQPAAVYSFGPTAPAPTPASAAHVQFNMGSAPSARRVRKAVRRNPPR